MLALVAAASAFAPSPVVLVTFDGSETDRKWQDRNDPVMGGQSNSTFAVQDGAGVFSGTCALVPFLKAPGFCMIGTEQSLIAKPKFADASAFIDGSLYLTVKSTMPSYAGFKVDIGAKNLTRPPGSHSHGGTSLKANFSLPAEAATDFVTVKIPFRSFSTDWSDFTGNCNTKDPDGFQHVCCDAKHAEVCPTARQQVRRGRGATSSARFGTEGGCTPTRLSSYFMGALTRGGGSISA